jgi:hypothetical protein
MLTAARRIRKNLTNVDWGQENISEKKENICHAEAGQQIVEHIPHGPRIKKTVLALAFLSSRFFFHARFNAIVAFSPFF